jgi:hypothetical protein
MAASGITPNDLPDDAVNGFQLFEAYLISIRNYANANAAWFIRPNVLSGGGEKKGISTSGENKIVILSTGGTDNVNYSTDRGVTWNQVTAENSTQWVSVTRMNARYVAVGLGGTNLVMVSDDDGASWTPKTAAGNSLSQWFKIESQNSMVAIAAQAGHPWAPLMRTDDAGNTWALVTANIDGCSDLVYNKAHRYYASAATSDLDLLVTSVNLGVTWTALPNVPFRPDVLGANSVVVIAISGVNIATSIDNGATWVVANDLTKRVDNGSNIVWSSYSKKFYLHSAKETLISINGSDWAYHSNPQILGEGHPPSMVAVGVGAGVVTVSKGDSDASLVYIS